MIASFLPDLHFSLSGIVTGAVLGAIVGSFMATLVLRWEQDLSISSGRSRCDTCGQILSVGELVPLVSYVLQHGCCRRCRASIDPLHWWVEAGTAIVGAASFMLAPSPIHAIGWIALGGLLLTLALIDARNLWLPNVLTSLLAVSGLVAGHLLAGTGLRDGLIGLAAGYGSLTLIATAYRRLRGHDGLGAGDAKLLAGLGAWFGWQSLANIVLVSALIALGWVLLQTITGTRINRKTAIPLGTFLCIGAIPGWYVYNFIIKI